MNKGDNQDNYIYYALAFLSLMLLILMVYHSVFPFSKCSHIRSKNPQNKPVY